jgi:hypothetical protein
MLVEKGKAHPQPLAENILRPLVERGVEQRAKTALVDLAGEKVQPGLKSCPLDGPIRRRELSRRIAVCDVLAIGAASTSTLPSSSPRAGM